MPSLLCFVIACNAFAFIEIYCQCIDGVGINEKRLGIFVLSSLCSLQSFSSSDIITAKAGTNFVGEAARFLTVGGMESLACSSLHIGSSRAIFWIEARSKYWISHLGSPFIKICQQKSLVSLYRSPLGLS